MIREFNVGVRKFARLAFTKNVKLLTEGYKIFAEKGWGLYSLQILSFSCTMPVPVEKLGQISFYV